MMRNPILSVIEELRAEGLHPTAIRVHELADGAGELDIMLEDMVAENPEDVLNGPVPAGVSCRIMARVPDWISPLPGGRTEWIAWIRDVARLGGAPDYCIYEPCDPLAAVEANAYQWSILTRPIRWLTYKLRRDLKLGDYEHDACECPLCLVEREAASKAVAAT